MTKHQLLTYPLLCFLAFFYTSCTTTSFYTPNAVHTPLLREKKDIEINASGRKLNGVELELQGAYAPLDHLVILANGMTSKYKGYSGKTRVNFAEAGAGLFHAMGSKSSNRPLRIEFVGGYGLGSASRVRGDSYFTGDYQRKFLQADIGIKDKIIEVGGGLRLTEVNFTNYSRYFFNVLSQKNELDFTMLEPYTWIAVGYKGLKIGLQVTVPKIVRNKGDYISSPSSIYDLPQADISVRFSTWQPRKTPEPIYRLHADHEAEFGMMDLQISQSSCWACIPATASYSDAVDIGLNGALIEEKPRKYKQYSCNQLSLKRDTPNLLTISLKPQWDTQPIPIELMILEGELEHPFYIDASNEQPQHLRLIYSRR